MRVGLANLLFYPLYLISAAKKTNKEIFAELAFPSHLIPEDFREHVHGKIEILNSEQLANNPTLKVGLAEFVAEQIELANQLQRIKTECFVKSPGSNLAKLRDVKIEGEFPSDYLDPFDKNIMTYPVQINHGCDDELIMDLRTLLRLWSDNKSNFTNPKSGRLIHAIKLYVELKNVIDEAVERKIRETEGYNVDNGLETQIACIEKEIKKQPQRNETALEILLAKNYTGKIPDHLIASNLYNQIMTHPVLLDKTYCVCYVELCKYWEEGKPLLNPYTGKKIQTITYDVNVKNELEAFLADPEKYLKEFAEKKLCVTQAPNSILFSPPAPPSLLAISSHQLPVLSQAQDSILPSVNEEVNAVESIATAQLQSQASKETTPSLRISQ